MAKISYIDATCIYEGAIGDHVGVAVDAGTAHLFNARTGLRLTA